jgi:hypothetical protein
MTTLKNRISKYLCNISDDTFLYLIIFIGSMLLNTLFFSAAIFQNY